MKAEDIKFFLRKHGNGGAKLEQIIRKTGIVNFRNTIMMNNDYKKYKRGELSFEFSKVYEEHKAEFKKVYSLLEDEFSKETYKAVVNFRRSHNISKIRRVNVQPQYFLKEIVPPLEDEVFVDGGGYDGATSKDFVQKYAGGSNYQLYVWECDAENIKTIKKNLSGLNYEIIPYAMWEKHENLRFDQQGSSLSMVSEYGSEFVEANSIDIAHKGKKISFIKMDIEGSEIEALHGARNTIMNQKPKLAISIYHRDDHLYRIPLLIKEMVPEYRIYIRHHSDLSSETVLYAVI